MNIKTLSRAVFHGAVATTYLCALVKFQMLPPFTHNAPHEHYAGRWKYLTYWNLVAQFLYFALSFLVDFMKAPSSNYHRFTKIRDTMYASIIFPYGAFVVAVFWTLYAINREIIFPKILDAMFPFWLNHVGHTIVLPVVLIEAYMLRHKHPRRKDGVAICAVFGLVYNIWVLYLGLEKDIWAYPILRMANWGLRGAFFGGSIFFVVILYMIGEKINSCCWGEGIVSKNK